MTRPLMACGCRSHGDRVVEGRVVGPICAVHLEERVAPEPDLTGRLAQCSCGRAAPSSLSLPMFAHQPEREHDRWYCGCRGWD